MKEKVKKITLKVQYFNVVVFPKEKQEPQTYITLLDKIRNDKVTINTYQDKCMRILSLEKIGELYVGKLANFTQLDDEPWFDDDSEQRKVMDIDKHLHPNYKEWDFYFLPSVHCLCLPTKSSVSQTRKFFEKAFEEVLKNQDDVHVNIECITSFETIEAIFASQNLTKLEIDVSYSNNDNNEGWEALMDNNMKDSNVDKFKGTFSSLKDKSLSFVKDSFIGGLVSLTRKNGSAKAHERKGRKIEVIDTDRHPQVDKLQVEENNKYPALTELIKKAAGNGDN